MPSGLKRRDGAPLYRPRYPALVKDRVRWVGDYVAFVVAETYHQAADAAELIEVDYEPLPAVVDTASAIEPGAPLVFDDCPNNICFVHLYGDKATTDAAFAQAAHVVKHRFIINRVTAAWMEPRGSVGDLSAGRWALHPPHHASAHLFLPRGAGEERPEGPGEQDPGDVPATSAAPSA